MNSDLWQDKVRKGMQVVDAQGAPLGTVKDIGEDSFGLAREAGFDTRLPYSAIKDVMENFVRLNQTSDQIDQSGIAHEETPFKPSSG